MDLEQIIPDGSFVALDFETAQSHRGICEIGIATFRGWKIQEQWGTRVNPPISFHSKCIDKHKITPECVENSPRLDDVWNTLAGMLRNQVVVCHRFHYDKTTLKNDAEHHGLNIPEISSWECSLLIAQSFWPGEFDSGKGSGELGNVARSLRIPLHHHRSIDDAFAAGMILVQAHNGVVPDSNPDRQKDDQAEDHKETASTRKDAIADAKRPKPRPNEEGRFTGQSLYVSGGKRGEKKDIEEMAAEAGFKILKGVVREMNLLVVLPCNSDGSPSGKEKRVDQWNTNEKKPANIKKMTGENFIRHINDGPA